MVILTKVPPRVILEHKTEHASTIITSSILHSRACQILQPTTVRKGSEIVEVSGGEGENQMGAQLTVLLPLLLNACLIEFFSSLPCTISGSQ